MLSQRALSWHLPPALFMLCFTPYSFSAALYEALVYWLPRSEWSTAQQNSGYAAAVFSTVAAHNSALMLSSIDSRQLSGRNNQIFPTHIACHYHSFDIPPIGFCLQLSDRIFIIPVGGIFFYSSLKFFWTPGIAGGFRYIKRSPERKPRGNLSSDPPLQTVQGRILCPIRIKH